jgi:branched-chain amino acid transport system ATP-binding protein
LYLNVTDVSIFYDTAQVLNRMSLHVNKGELVSLVGPNGAGKTTLLRTISGLVKWQKDSLKGTKLGRITIEGTIVFDGVAIENVPAHKIAAMGLVLCPERGQPFREMTVKENLMAATYLYRDKRLIEESLEKVYSLFPVLKAREKQISGTVSGGERTMLAIGRALMAQAKILLVDEPSTGLAPKFRDELFGRLSEIHGMGLSILLVEQDVSYAFQVASRNYVISQGQIVKEGTAQELMADEFLRKTYLGL